MRFQTIFLFPLVLFLGVKVQGLPISTTAGGTEVPSALPSPFKNTAAQSSSNTIASGPTPPPTIVNEPTPTLVKVSQFAKRRGAGPTGSDDSEPDIHLKPWQTVLIAIVAAIDLYPEICGSVLGRSWAGPEDDDGFLYFSFKWTCSKDPWAI
ncbi:hypothetical protein HYFRA_00012163 [Hymenoscyphus fraxineus]|uniref:Uncharacterized protein n=1 Tax=Hymenoscyphus fraxineus TaxID=746836 RepID=A0A9N9L4L9_9HELO|nr:hypothetical protein HYFRA_00012163 [Hymenoscyphus fraxineus]